MAENVQQNVSATGVAEAPSVLLTDTGNAIWNVVRDASIVFPYADTAEDVTEKTEEARAEAVVATEQETSHPSGQGFGFGHLRQIVAKDPLAVATVYQLDRKEALASQLADLLLGPLPKIDHEDGEQETYGIWYGAVEDLLPPKTYFAPTANEVAAVRASYELSRQMHRDAGSDDFAALFDRVLQGSDRAANDLYRAQLRSRRQLVEGVLAAAGVEQPASWQEQSAR